MEVRRVLCQGYRPTRSSAAIKWPRGPRARHLNGLCPHQCNDGIAGPRQVLIIMCSDQDRWPAHLLHSGYDDQLLPTPFSVATMTRQIAINNRLRPSMATPLLKNGTHATKGGSRGPASGAPLPFLGVTCWSLSAGIKNARRNEDLRRRSCRGPPLRGG